jgi:hypothetical protein
MTLRARIRGVGLVGPGWTSWPEARDALAGRSPYVASATSAPSPEALPATERRRAGKSVRVALGAGLAAAADAGIAPRELAAIFASSGGDGDTLHEICETLASDDRAISPTRFHNSVHNAPAGYWGIATGAMKPSDTVAAFDATFAAGLLEAATRLAADPASPVLLIAYDAPYPEPLYATRPVTDMFGVGLVLDGAEGGARITMALCEEPPTALAEPALEGLRVAIPAARSLPLLRLIARGEPGRAVLEYLSGRALSVEYRP